MQQPLLVHTTTHVGLVHERNEDSLAVIETGEGGVLLLVCDGMGGMGHGDLASAMAVERITGLMQDSTGFPSDRMRSAIREADIEIRDRLCDDNRGLPGSTAVMIYVVDGVGHVAWVGDSRAYLVRGSRVVERTRDHKLVAELVAAGQITEEEAKTSTLAHVVTRALGGRSSSERAVKGATLGHPWKLANGDTLMLCSDGVCDLISDEEIGRLVGESSDPESGCEALQQLALDRGGHDNITCIVATWEGEDYVEDDVSTPSFGRRDYRPDQDLREHIQGPYVDEVPGNVTEEIEPGWQADALEGDDEDTGITYKELFDDEIEAALAARALPPRPSSDPDPTGAAEDAFLNPMLRLAIVVAVLVIFGLVLALSGN